MSSELERDGAPLRLMLLGEKLIRVPRQLGPGRGHGSPLARTAAPRCFSAATRRTAIRCVYHGWEYDAAGNCVDMPNAPPHQDFKDKVKARAYKVDERNGLVWVYMGVRKEAPPLPGYRKPRYCPRASSRSSSRNANATGCRRSKAISIPRISAFCTPARSLPKMSRPTI